MVDCRYQYNNKLENISLDMYSILSKELRISLIRSTSTDVTMLYDGFDIRDIDEDLQDSVYKRINYGKLYI